tara:strand:- start:244 stop:561 length:318 start_codon:yes stop_codon:yes gene_type:complete
MAAHELIPWLLTPNTRGWIVAPNYSLGQKVAREVKRMVQTQLKLPIDSKKEHSGDLYFMRLSGLNSELSVKSADSPDSLIGSLPPGKTTGGQKKINWRRCRLFNN